MLKLVSKICDAFCDSHSQQKMPAVTEETFWNGSVLCLDTSLFKLQPFYLLVMNQIMLLRVLATLKHQVNQMWPRKHCFLRKESRIFIGVRTTSAASISIKCTEWRSISTQRKDKIKTEENPNQKWLISFDNQVRKKFQTRMYLF